MTEAVRTRHQQIIDLVRDLGRATVEELAEKLGVTAQTIRKDLNDLGGKNLLSRVHGGATALSGVENVSYAARRQIAQDAKRAIGRAAAAMIPERASLFINIGTTTEEVARALEGRSGLLVITNNLNVIDILGQNPNNELIVTGGRIRHVDRAAVGATAVDFISNFKVDLAVIGSSAIDEDGALLDFDINEVQVSKAILQNARSTILVADQRKLGRAAPVRIAHIGDIDVFVTDELTSPALRTVCEAHGVRVIEALPRAKGGETPELPEQPLEPQSS